MVLHLAENCDVTMVLVLQMEDNFARGCKRYEINSVDKVNTNHLLVRWKLLVHLSLTSGVPMEGVGVTCYGGLPATVEGDSKSASGLATTRSEHLSLQHQPLYEEYVVLVAQTTTDAHLFIYNSSSNSYTVSVCVLRW